MKDLLRQADEIPVTLLVALAYGTLAVVTNMFGPQEEFLQKLQACGHLTPHLVAAGEPWRLVTHAFLHFNALHLLVNMASLFSLAPGLERSLGSVRFAALYVTSALGGGLAVCLVYQPGQPVVGGSGALFGMLGAAVAMNMRAGRHLFAFLDFEGPRRLLSTIVFNLLLGFLLPFISNTAHLGGLVAGFLVTFLWLWPGRGPSPALRRWRLAFAAWFASLVFASLMPVTRYDWLWDQHEKATDPVLREALGRAAVRDKPEAFVPADEPAPKTRRR